MSYSVAFFASTIKATHPYPVGLKYSLFRPYHQQCDNKLYPHRTGFFCSPRGYNQRLDTNRAALQAIQNGQKRRYNIYQLGLRLTPSTPAAKFCLDQFAHRL